MSASYIRAKDTRQARLEHGIWEKQLNLLVHEVQSYIVSKYEEKKKTHCMDSGASILERAT
jgi:hypothetical protein